MFTRVRAALAAVSIGLALASPSLSLAQSADSKPYTIIVPYSAGSASDILARRVAERMSKTLNSPFIVETAVGAGGVIGTLRAQKAAPDGRTLLIGTQGTLLMNKYIYKTLKYDPDKDFMPVVNLVSYPNLILVPKSLNVKTLADFIALAKARAAEKKPLNYGSGGAGSSSHLGAELLKLEAGIDLAHVPYKAIADTTSDILGGRLDVILGSVSTFAPFVKSGELVALAVTSAVRSPVLPDIPTIGELGYKAAEFSAWNGLFVPAAVPTPVVEKLRAAVVEATTAAPLRATFAAEGTDIEADAPVAFKEYIASEGKKWEPVIRKLNISLD